MKSPKKPTFSIIICLYIVTDRFFKDLARFQELNFTDYELIIVAEKSSILPKLDPSIRVVRTGKDKISLGEKRDVGLRAANGDYCAFIDDDAYPHPDWLTNALAIFKSNQKIGAVGGPNITAPDDPYAAKIGGSIYESYLTSGKAQYRFVPSPRQKVLELQGVNLILRTDILNELDGFHSKLSSGDDSKICSDIRRLGYSIIYDPKVAVFHHRRSFPVGHLKQIRNMGTHRGFFVKAYPETLTPIYFLPTVLALIFVIGLITSFFNHTIALVFGSGLLIAWLIGLVDSLGRAGLAAPIVSLGIIATHITYGLFFIRGLFLRKIEA